MGSDLFAGAYQQVHDFIFFECLDDGGRPQGFAIGEIQKKYRADDDGAFVELRYVQCSDEYYRHWVGEQAGERLFHHLCTHPLSTCKRKIGNEGGIVHVQRWAAMTKNEAVRTLDDWGLTGLKAPVLKIKNKELREITPKATAAKAASHPREKGDPGILGIESEDFETSEDEMMPPVKAGVEEPPQTEKRPRGRDSRAREKDRDRGRRHERPKDEKTGVGQFTASRSKRRSPLDAMVDDSMDLDEKREVDNESRIEELRTRLGDTKKKKESARASASTVLVGRVKEANEKQPKDRKRPADDMMAALKTLTRRSKKRRTSDSSSEESSGQEDDIYGGKGSDLASKQRKLKKLAEEKPGTLVLRGFQHMHDQLGTVYGSGASGSSGPDQALQPAALRYLLTCCLPLIQTEVPEQTMRELRTISTCLDLLVVGKAVHASDMLCQRFKSVLMGLRDGSSIASRYIELIPSETWPTATSEAETGFARSVAFKAAKSEALLERMTKPG